MVLGFMAVGAVTILAVVLIVLALVFYLVSVILQLQKIANGLDEVIVHVSEIVQKSAPVNDVVTSIKQQLNTKDNMARRGGRGLPELPGKRDGEGARHRRGLHERHAHARTARPRSADRCRQSGGLSAPKRRGWQPRGTVALSGEPPDEAGVPAAVTCDRRRLAGAVRAA